MRVVPLEFRCKAINRNGKEPGSRCIRERANREMYADQSLDFELCGIHIFQKDVQKVGKH